MDALKPFSRGLCCYCTKKVPRHQCHHGDGYNHSGKGGDNLGFSGHKHFKGDKVVAFCDRRCNVIAFIAAPGNRDESPLLLIAPVTTSPGSDSS